MIILGIETSCDETAAAVLKKDGNRIEILSNVIASSAKLQQKFGGIIPEQAAREQLKSIIPVIKEALAEAFPPPTSHLPPPVDAIAVTQGPGLIGSLLVGVETAKVLSLTWKKPLIPVNHLIGHFYANWITSAVSRGGGKRGAPKTARSEVATSEDIFGAVGRQGPEKPTFPCIGLLVSGGHTDLVLFEYHNKYKYLGGTRDDAAGECFDKCARLLGLPYPGGPQISKLAKSGNPKSFDLPRPMIYSKDFDFSFSGLKTAVANLLKEVKNPNIADLCASIEESIVEVLIKKTIAAAQKYKIDQIMVAGGVAANQKLTSELKLKIENLKLKINLHIPSANLCTDNGAMIASAAFFQKPIKDPLSIQADPNLSL